MSSLGSIPECLKDRAIALAESANPDMLGLDPFEILEATGSEDSFDVTLQTGADTDDTWLEAAVAFASKHESVIAPFLLSAVDQAMKILPFTLESEEGNLKVKLEDRRTADPTKLTVGVTFSVEASEE